MDESRWCWIKGVCYNLDLIRRVTIQTKYTPEEESDHVMIVFSNGDTERISMDDSIMCDIIEEKLLRKTR